MPQDCPNGPPMHAMGGMGSNASLYAEGRSNTVEDELEEEDELDEGVLGNYRSRHILDKVYVNERKVDIVDSWQDSRVTAVVDKHKAVFQK